MKINKYEDFSKWYNTIIKQAQLCDLRYNVKGFVVFMPNSVFIMKKMYEIYEKKLEELDHKPYWFPAVIPKSNFQLESEHIKGFVPDVFWIEKVGENTILEEPLALRPTSETAMYTMFSKWIQGANDLPLKTYHSSQVWRYETKATKPFIRSREFFWIETHNAFKTKEESIKQVNQDMQITKQILTNVFGIPFIYFRRPEWDKFPGAEDTFAADTLMPDSKALQLPSTHLLGQNFSKPFDIKYLDSNGNYQYCYQTCYGPAISRIFSALICFHGDDFGLIFPSNLVLKKIAIIPIFKNENKQEIITYCKKIQNQLNEKNISNFIDDGEKTAGFKFNEYELLGIPLRIEIGPKDMEKNGLTLVSRIDRKKEFVLISNFIEKINEKLKNQDELLKNKADSWFNKKISYAKTIDQLIKNLNENKGFIKVPFCSREKQGENCAKIIKEKTSSDARGTLFNLNEKPKEDEVCLVCEKKAQEYMYFAKQY